MLTPYVTINSKPEFCRNKTGFGYMVYDIAKAVGKIEYVDVLATDSRGEAFEMEGVKYLHRSLWGILKNVWQCLPIAVLLRLLRQYKMSNGNVIRIIYYWLFTGYLRQVLKVGKYDIVHIHGLKYPTAFWMEVCKQTGVKYILTSHGLNSFSDTVKMEAGEKLYERDLLKKVVNGEIALTVISTGMKRLIEKTYGVYDSKNITVVCNSFSFGDIDNKENIEKNESVKGKYGIPQGAKFLLYVGNISENKNQRQMVDAYELLPKDIKNSTWVLFCGGGDLDSLRFAVNGLPLEDQKHLVLCGVVEKSEISNYYKEGDGVVLLSWVEGFGLSLVEGMHYGRPCLMFRDMEAFEDIYNEKAVIGVTARTNKAVADGIVTLLNKGWDERLIKDYSKKFNSQTMAENYLNEYKKIIER